MIVSMDGTDLAQTHVNMGLAKTPITENGTTIGYKYVLTLTELEQDAIAVGKNYLDYSGPVIITIPKGSMTDNSGNTNPTKTISVGPGNNILKPDENEATNIDLVNPTWTADSNNISFTNFFNLSTSFKHISKDFSKRSLSFFPHLLSILKCP